MLVNITVSVWARCLVFPLIQKYSFSLTKASASAHQYGLIVIFCFIRPQVIHDSSVGEQTNIFSLPTSYYVSFILKIDQKEARQKLQRLPSSKTELTEHKTRGTNLVVNNGLRKITGVLTRQICQGYDRACHADCSSGSIALKIQLYKLMVIKMIFCLVLIGINGGNMAASKAKGQSLISDKTHAFAVGEQYFF